MYLATGNNLKSPSLSYYKALETAMGKFTPAMSLHKQVISLVGYFADQLLGRSLSSTTFENAFYFSRGHGTTPKC
jgi:hypothetical protein